MKIVYRCEKCKEIFEKKTQLRSMDVPNRDLKSNSFVRNTAIKLYLCYRCWSDIISVLE